MVATGVVPKGFTDTLMSLLPKPPKPGAKAIRTRLFGYRKISAIKSLYKIISFVLYRCLNHFLTTLSPSDRCQAGFSLKQNTEQQLATLLDTILEQGAPSQPGAPPEPTDPWISAIFVDIVEAFYKLGHDALLLKLERRGLSPRLIRLIKALYAVLPCVFFLIFIDNLSRSI